MENFFSRLTLDIIGKAVFNYDFDSLTHDDPIIQAGLPSCSTAWNHTSAPLDVSSHPSQQVHWIRCCTAAQKGLQAEPAVAKRIQLATS